MLGTSGSNWTLIFVKVEALWIELQSQIIDKFTNFSLRISNEPLVIHAADGTGQHNIEVFSQSNIVTPIGCEVGQIITKFLPASKPLSIIRP